MATPTTMMSGNISYKVPLAGVERWYLTQVVGPSPAQRRILNESPCDLRSKGGNGR